MFRTLRDNISYWKEVCDNSTVLKWITDGIQLPFSKLPNKFYFKNRQFTFNEINFIDNEVSRLLKAGCIVKNKTASPNFVSPINVVPKRKGSRLILDLRHLNNHIKPPSFVYETIVVKITKINDYKVTWDLEQGFHHLPIHKDYYDYLCFQWKNEYFNWIVTPFGGNFSPYFFCKTIREVVKHFRQNSLKTVVYVDDFYLCDDIQCIENKTNWARQELGRLG